MQPHVRAAIDAIRAKPSLYERHAADPVVLAVLQVQGRGVGCGGAVVWGQQRVSAGVLV
jgi:hypothetical protein